MSIWDSPPLKLLFNNNNLCAIFNDNYFDKQKMNVIRTLRRRRIIGRGGIVTSARIGSRIGERVRSSCRVRLLLLRRVRVWWSRSVLLRWNIILLYSFSIETSLRNVCWLFQHSTSLDTRYWINIFVNCLIHDFLINKNGQATSQPEVSFHSNKKEPQS